jgi:hypothetical protein
VLLDKLISVNDDEEKTKPASPAAEADPQLKSLRQ